MLIGVLSKKNFYVPYSGVKMGDLELIRMIRNNIFLRVCCLKCGWHPFNAGHFTCAHVKEQMIDENFLDSGCHVMESVFVFDMNTLQTSPLQITSKSFGMKIFIGKCFSSDIETNVIERKWKFRKWKMNTKCETKKLHFNEIKLKFKMHQ